jgi:tetratricopeptide (TPR) repeat protein
MIDLASGMGSWILDFLKDESNQKMLAFYGGGAVMVIGGLWKAYTFWVKRKYNKPPPSQPSMTVSAPGGIAAGGNPNFYGSVTIGPDLKEVGKQLAEVAGGVASRIDQLPAEIVAQLVAILDQRGETARAAEGGLERRTILELARRLKPDEVIDLDQAIKELEYLVGIALDVIAKGERGTNDDTFVNDVLKRLAVTTKAGLFDSGSQAVDQALTELDRREEEQRDNLRRSRETLLEAGVKQDILRRDALAVAHRIEAIAALDSVNGHPAWSQKYQEWLQMLLAEGERGVNFSLEVAIEMSWRMEKSASNSEQQSEAHYFRGRSLFELGSREIGSDKLNEALAAFETSLNFCQELSILQVLIYRRLGETLTRLAEADQFNGKNNSTEWLARAIATFEMASVKDLQERLPLEWAAIKNSLGIAYRQLGKTTGKAEPYINAFRAYNESLKVCTRELYPLQWAITKSNIGNILSEFHDHASNTGGNVEAEAAYRAALRVRARTS